MLPLDYRIHCGAIQNTFIFILQGVQTLTREDRDIMDGSTFFVVLINLRRATQQKKTNEKSIIYRGGCNVSAVRLH